MLPQQHEEGPGFRPQYCKQTNGRVCNIVTVSTVYLIVLDTLSQFCLRGQQGSLNTTTGGNRTGLSPEPILERVVIVAL